MTLPKDDPVQPTTDDLRPWGYAPGPYFFNCVECGHAPQFRRPIGDKRSIRCEQHARKAREEAEWRAAQPPLVCDMEPPHA